MPSRSKAQMVAAVVSQSMVVAGRAGWTLRLETEPVTIWAAMACWLGPAMAGLAKPR